MLDQVNIAVDHEDWHEVLKLSSSLIANQRHFYQGHALNQLGRFREALAITQWGLMKCKNDKPLTILRAMLYARMENWSLFFRYHEDRFKVYEGLVENFALYPPSKRWEGQSGHLVLVSEQGIGDTIQFLRFIPLIRGCEITVVCDHGLNPLLEHQTYIDHCRSMIPREDSYDYWCPLLSVPYVLGLDCVPAEPYLKSPGEAKFPEGKNIGITWAGNPAFSGDRKRSIPLDKFGPIIECGNIWSFQCDKRKRKYAEEKVYDLSAHPSDWKINDIEGKLKTWMHTAVWMNKLDWFVSCDTASLHLAGAMGIPCIGLIASSPCWRWGVKERSPWYPSMNLCRQSHYTDWDSPIKEAVNCITYK